MQTSFGHTVFWKLVSGWFSDTQNSHKGGAECPRIIDIQYIYRKMIVPKIFIFKYLKNILLSFYI